MASNQLPAEVESSLRDSESVQWVSSSHSIGKLIESIFGSVLFFGFLTVFLTAFLGVFGKAVVGAGIGVGLILLWTLLSIAQYVVGGTTHVATDERVISFSEGFLDSSMEYIDWGDVQTVDVDKSLLDNIFGTGSLTVEGHKVDDIKIKYVANPYDSLSELENLK